MMIFVPPRSHSPRRGGRPEPPRPAYLVAVLVAIVGGVGSAVTLNGLSAVRGWAISPGLTAAVAAGVLMSLLVIGIVVARLMDQDDDEAPASHGNGAGDGGSVTPEGARADCAVDERRPIALAIAAAAVAIGLIMALLVLAAKPAAAQAAARASDAGAFVIRTATDTLVVERFTRTADSLQGSVAVKGAPRMDYMAALGPGHTVRWLSLSVFREYATPDEQPIQRALITMQGDSAIAEVGAATQRIATKAGAIPAINNSFALFELFVRRARAAGGSLDIPYFATGGGVTIVVSVKPAGADSVVATVAGVENRLRVDADGRILGGVLPAQKIEVLRVSSAAAAGLKVGRVSYAAPAGAPYTAEDVELKGAGGITLGGTLTLPRSAGRPVPAIVTITGSGQQDRDEYIGVGGGYRPFRQVADTLGRRGVAVLRLDDRMIGASGGQIGTSADYASDIRAALAYLRTRREVDARRLGVLGHSEGGLIGPMVAAEEPSLRALVILAGPAYRGRDVIAYQQRYAVERDTTIAPARRDSVLAASMRKADSATVANVWYSFFFTYDPLPAARKVRTPTLVLQGATDSQVTPEQAEKLAGAIRAGGNRDVTVRVFPARNHLFLDDADGSFLNYARLKNGRIGGEVLGAVADWVAAKLDAKPAP